MKDCVFNCTEWLYLYLCGCQGGQADYREVKAAAADTGFSRAELKAARKELGIETKSNWIPGRPADEWVWCLPEAKDDD